MTAAGLAPPGYPINQEPGATTTQPPEEPQVVLLRRVVDGTYEAFLHGIARGNYELEVIGRADDSIVCQRRLEGAIEEEEKWVVSIGVDEEEGRILECTISDTKPTTQGPRAVLPQRERLLARLPPMPTPKGSTMHRYEPPATFPDPATLPVVDCWTGSLSTLRSDGFRCSLGNTIHDPCFLSTEAMILACPGDPRDESMTIFARWGGEEDPADVRGPTGEEFPWFLVLDAPGNPTCGLVTGATGELPGGRRADFACSGGIDWCASPEPTGSGDLVVYCYPGVRPDWSEEEMLAVEIAYTVSEAWY
jgi:hypothetical protein